MITIKDAEEILKKEYHIDNFLYVVDNLLLPDFKADKHDVSFHNGIFASVQQLGHSDKCDVDIYEVVLNEGAQNRRVAITQEMFRVLRGLGVNNAIVAFVNADRRNYRFSLLTSKYEFDGDKIVRVLSNPRRYSYSLGYGTKTKTAYDFLIGKGKVNSLDELINRFSVEIVNKQFYNEIALAFTKLVGGQRDGKSFEKELNLYGVVDQNKYAEFAVRLIGRIVFCWFLKEKKSENGIPLIPESMLALDAIKADGNYYHDVLEPLFFELLNTNLHRRKGKFAREEVYMQIPYLNGGLFSPHADDHYKFNAELQTGQYGLVTIPNEWFVHFYETLGQYNFTVDENTSYDIELSIDPEMLGRIFENLLAEINPETGENAKKSTGSFYTPRDIVDYMVDSSILEYLKNKTGIDEVKLRALISYNKEDDDLAVFSMPEKKALINALYTVTVLDPACGSGAFPIGMLQKIVYMLQEIDPEANLWFDKATENISILMRKEFEKKFNAGSLDYIRKLTVIQNSIFGIDIQPIAVEIARLRCFLSLVIEEKVYDDEPNRGINPLPNLDFKFIIANTLVSLPHDSDTKKDVSSDQLSMFEKQDHIAQLKAVREEYFSANDLDSKNELKLAFSEIQKAMFQETLDSRKMASPRYQALFQWKPFSNESTSWFDPEWMFGVKNGFDIVIGNPPYVLLQTLNKSMDEYFKRNYIVASYKIDLFHLFFQKGIDLLNEQGVLGYITPNTYFTNKYIKPLRKYILDNCSILEIVNYDKVFDSASVDTATIIMTKDRRAHKIVTIFHNHHSAFAKICEKNQDTWYDGKDYVFNINKETATTFKNCTSLGEICQTYFGIQAFDRKTAISNFKQNDDYLPMIDGADIHPYTYAKPTLYFEFIPQNIKSGGDWEVYAKQRIVVRQIGQTPIVGLCREGVLGSNTLYSIYPKNSSYNLIFLLACLNSKFIKNYWKSKYSDNKGLFPKIKGYQLKELPIPVVTKEKQEEIAALVTQIICSGESNKDLEKEINHIVCRLYGMDEKAIATFEETSN